MGRNIFVLLSVLAIGLVGISMYSNQANAWTAQQTSPGTRATIVDPTYGLCPQVCPSYYAPTYGKVMGLSGKDYLVVITCTYGASSYFPPLGDASQFTSSSRVLAEASKNARSIVAQRVALALR